MATRRPEMTLDDDAPLTQMTRLPPSLRPRPRRAHLLECTKGPTAPSRHTLDADSLVIGRGTEVDLAVETDSVSRVHARLFRIDEEYNIEDLDSRNGVFLNGLRIHAAVLRDGDQVTIGDALFTYHEGT